MRTFLLAIALAFMSSIAAQEIQPKNIKPIIHFAGWSKADDVSKDDYDNIAKRIAAFFVNGGRCHVPSQNEDEVFTAEDYQYIVSVSITKSQGKSRYQERKEKKYKKVKKNGKTEYEEYEETIKETIYTHNVDGRIKFMSQLDNKVIAEYSLDRTGEYTDKMVDGKWEKGEGYSKEAAKNDAFSSVYYCVRAIIFELFPVEANLLPYDYTEKGKKITKVGIDVGDNLIKKDMDFKIMVPIVKFGEVTYECIGYMTAETVLDKVTECDVTKGQTKLKTRSRLGEEMKEYKKRLKKDPDNPYPIKAVLVTYSNIQGLGEFF